MSVPGVTVPVMDDLGILADEITRFASEHDMTVIPVIPGTESGPAVLLDPRDLDLTAFLGLARRLGDGALYVGAEIVGTDPETGEPDHPVKEHLESLAAEFLASPGWQEAASAAARKKAAESFLSSRADGWCPPSFIRDELYAQAQRLAKSGGGPGLFPPPSK